jgi:hypothetical protein
LSQTIQHTKHQTSPWMSITALVHESSPWIEKLQYKTVPNYTASQNYVNTNGLFFSCR